MQNTTKLFRKITGMACLIAAINLAGCSCNSKNTSSTSSDSSATKDSASVKTDSASVMKAAPDSASLKMAPVDSLASPTSNAPKKDTTIKPRPIDRKTRS
ncbi:hypothetical protein [Mucilaginibacter aquaedulcis]|uniref:hypothetical protein n=1 Tax=Mucilaginibacter aquaedulcis TaxID=1187081 RepID=UPI0025B4B7E6|nr:hypothetical protein [Mucilaginibacter aquaedulcis]MDN3546746.1 hypothetical protein [Mucilaginibacter aquaedulcis]